MLVFSILEYDYLIYYFDALRSPAGAFAYILARY